MARATKTKTRYSPHPSLAHAQAIVANMEAKTGRSLDAWVRLVRAGGPPADAARAEWLRAEHGLGSNYAAWIVERAAGRGAEDTDPDAYLRAAASWVEAMFAGPKVVLRPIYDALLDAAFALGRDVRVCPCRTIVPVFRTHVIAQVKIATRSRVDFGLALGKHRGKLPPRLVDTGGAAKKDRITHKLEVTEPGQVDAELRRWLQIAYDLDPA